MKTEKLKNEKVKSIIIIGAVLILFSICVIQLNEITILTGTENNKATFFITSHYLNTASELVERMINEGHIVGNPFPTMVMYYI